MAQVVTGGGEKSGLGQGCALGLQPGGVRQVFGAFARADVGEGDHHPFDAIVLRPVGQSPTVVPIVVGGPDLTRDRHKAGEHGVSVAEERWIGEVLHEIGERPADVGGDHAEERFRRGREEAYIELLIQEYRRQIGAVQYVLEIVGDDALLSQGLLKLAV